MRGQGVIQCAYDMSRVHNAWEYGLLSDYSISTLSLQNLLHFVYCLHVHAHLIPQRSAPGSRDHKGRRGHEQRSRQLLIVFALDASLRGYATWPLSEARSHELSPGPQGGPGED